MYTTMTACKSYVDAVANAATRGIPHARIRVAGAILYAAEKARWWLSTPSSFWAAMATSQNTRPAACCGRQLYDFAAGTSEIRRMLIGP